MQRLSTGKRINSSADDAAGSQIVNRMTAEIQGLKQAIRNASDAQALLATAEGASEEIHIMLLRMRELAVQASNGTTSTADKTSLEAEAGQLELEITRIADNTTWAGIQLLDGAQSGGITFMVGSDSGQTIVHSIPELATSAATINYVAAFSIGAFANAQSAISRIDSAIGLLNTERGQQAAMMNRLDHTVANLQNVVTNLAQAKGRIEDADFATETANLARTQVLQQASMAMLSQANASKQNILSLFQ